MDQLSCLLVNPRRCWPPVACSCGISPSRAATSRTVSKGTICLGAEGANQGGIF